MKITHKKGKHTSNKFDGFKIRFWNKRWVRRVGWKVTFSQDTEYLESTKNTPLFEDEWLKGGGLTFGSLTNPYRMYHPHINTVMWAWRQFSKTDQFEISPYAHDSNKVAYREGSGKAIAYPKCTVKKDVPIYILLNVSRKNKAVQFVVVQNDVVLIDELVEEATLHLVSRDISPYFGGDATPGKDVSYEREIVSHKKVYQIMAGLRKNNKL